jgi:hypothetical protein
LNEAIELIRQLAQERFYGAITLKFEAGKVILLRKEETLKPANLSEHPRRLSEENGCS